MVLAKINTFFHRESKDGNFLNLIDVVFDDVQYLVRIVTIMNLLADISINGIRSFDEILGSLLVPMESTMILLLLPFFSRLFECVTFWECGMVRG